MDQMGSPFLLAHGLGEPVGDARTELRIPAAGNYRVWVRTRDWVATWNAPGAPGRFQLLLDGRPLSQAISDGLDPADAVRFAPQVALFDEPQRGSTTKPRVAQRTLGLGNHVKPNPNGVLHDRL